MKYKKIILGLILGVVFFGFQVPVVKAGEVCNDLNDRLLGILDCGSEDIVSFSGFQGGLTAPDKTGIDPTLTRVDSVRDFIKNTVNFALSFLGLVAMVVVIYGGFLYVTAAGNEEQSGKGKKAIQYAAIGIVIIIASFALVNTLIRFVGDDGTDRGDSAGGVDVRGAGDSGSNSSQQAIYSLGAAEINSSLNDFVGAYKNLAGITSSLKKLNSLPEPTDRDENRSYISEVGSLINEIKNSSNSLSKTHQAAKLMLDEYLSGLQNLSDEQLHAGKFGIEADGFKESMLGGGESKLADKIKENLKTKYKIADAAKADFDGAIDELISKNPPSARPSAQQTVSGRLPTVWKIMGNVANETTASQALERGLITQKDLERAFAGLDPNITVGQLFLEAIEKLNIARGLKDNPNDTEKLIAAVQSLSRLYIIVKDIKFVSVRVRASVTEGNAPLVVELSGLESRDPAAQTIPPEKYVWDPDGNAQPGVQNNNIDCTGDTGPTITCTYFQPGTYLARLTVDSQDPDHIAAGQSFRAITVAPPTARINLRASIGDSLQMDLRKYVQDSSGTWNLVVDASEFQVTTKEATEAGVEFNAEDTLGGDNEPVAHFLWTFGEGSPPEEGEAAAKSSVTHLYTREGRFPLQLEVTDRGKRKDRKLVSVIISSIAARIGFEKDVGEPDLLMEFDGSMSKSDTGSIGSYAWSVYAETGEHANKEITNMSDMLQIVGNPTGSVFRARFKKPGTYTVKLRVSDGSKSANTQTQVSIKSRKPRANLTVRACPEDCSDASQPSLVSFDASGSFDPDKGDELTYDWHILNELGDEVKAPSGYTMLDNVTLPSQTAKKIQLKFKQVGTYRVVLDIDDSHDDTIRQTDSREREFSIPSIVELVWAPQMKTTMKLENGRAKFFPKGTIRNAESLRIEYGDGQSDELHNLELTDAGEAFFDFGEDGHEYKKSGSFMVKLTATSDNGNGENTISKRVYVSGGDTPIAVLEVYLDKQEVFLPEPTRDVPEPALEIIRNRVVKFDASHSMNSKGEEKELEYQWSFGDRDLSSGPKTEHSYEDVSSDEPYMVTLTVTEKSNPNKKATATFPIRVVSKKPQVAALSLEKKTPGETTPVDVELKAEGAVDPDGGRITNYQFWYFTAEEKDRRLSVVDTQNDHATLTIETSGEENQENEYFFCVTVTDFENSTSECSELFQEEELPKIRVKNGPNKAPIAAFTVDKTSIKVGEEIRFTSSSTDEDGDIKEYLWDFDGDGFGNDNPTDLSSVTHPYPKKSQPGGYRVKLKVIDDKGAAGYSREIPIYVAAKSNNPSPSFQYQLQPGSTRRVKFLDQSTSDTFNGARIVEWQWDFNTSEEYGCDDPTNKPKYCDGKETNDLDSTDQNPIFDFPRPEAYQVQLTVVDSDGNTASTTGLVDLIRSSSGGTGSTTPVSGYLDAELTSDPNFRWETIGGQSIKVLRVPATSSSGQPIDIFPVSLIWGNSTGDIVAYKIDKNTHCDFDTKGGRKDDVQNPDVGAGTCELVSSKTQADHCWKTTYQRYDKTAHPRGPGHFTTQLTIVDRNGNESTDTLDIIFDGSVDPAKIRTDRCEEEIPKNLLGGSFFQDLGPRNTILLGLFSGVAAVLLAFGAASIFRRGKTRV